MRAARRPGARRAPLETDSAARRSVGCPLWRAQYIDGTADREKLQQILLNILSNAVKFTHTREGVLGRIEVSCSVEGSGTDARVHIRVCDTGDGIAPEKLERIFEPFVQADQGLTREHQGVGLGLAISRDLARGMGGDLVAESAPGVGSTLTLVLPAAGPRGG